MTRLLRGIAFYCVLENVWGSTFFLAEFEESLHKPTIPFVPSDHLKYSPFGVLFGLQSGAVAVSETKYPWIARMYRSGSPKMQHYPGLKAHPYCTAACISPRIFITSVYCVYNLRLKHHWIAYNSQFLYPLAIIMPTLLSKNGYDDIGLVVVQNDNTTKWNTVKIYTEMNRTDELFNWFRKTNINQPEKKIYKAIGYAKKDRASPEYDLYEINVAIDIDFCKKFHTEQLNSIYNTYDAYHVPCYYSCTYKEWRSRQKCTDYLNTPGAMVYNPASNQLVGVATWGSAPSAYALPAGFTVPNSKNFYEDYECAMKIRNDATQHVRRKHYQKLCDNK